ncbi:hypothetical protein HK101_009659 [Irineochytrium annulatum]|nr:hypothetical protein HK101_009659 [Irineochytrium annulatum]
MAQLMYTMAFDLAWGMAGNLLTLRSPSDTLFYISAAESFAITLIQRVILCLHFRVQRRKAMKTKAVVDVEDVPAVMVTTQIMPKSEDAEVVVVASDDAISSDKRVAPVTAMNSASGPTLLRANLHANEMPKGIAALTDGGNAGFAAVIFGAGDRPSEVNTSGELRGSTSSFGIPSMRRLHPRQESQVSSRFHTGLQEKNESSTGLRPIPSECGSANEPGSSLAVDAEEPAPEKDSSSSASLADQAPPPLCADDPFEPLDPSIKYGYLNFGVMLGETVGRIMAYIVMILFVTLPDASQWASYCGLVTTVQATERFAFLFAAGLVVDAASAHFDTLMLGFDYADALEYFTGAGISFNGYVYLCASIITVAGDYIIADTGVFMDVRTYQVGRKF